MIVCSLFDGMSCGQIAFQRAGINVDKYYASEVDKYAIQITQKNFPNTIQLGDIQKIKGSDLGHVDIVIGGSPCQGFSMSSNDKLNFNHPQSKLFFEYVRLLDEIKPKYFLLENVIMEQRHKEVINYYMETLPYRINSNRVSAQSRDRLYWTNIPNITQPKDKKIMLDTILQNDVELPVYSNIYGGYGELEPRIYMYKSPTLRAETEPPFATKISKDKLTSEIKVEEILGAKRSGVDRDKIRLFTPIECERLQTVPDNYTEGVSNAQRVKMLGNGWTVSVIAGIFKNLKGNPQPLGKTKQLKLV
tara:strand:- start:459 stop:1370 length:912 start_codon:yes stop_codon:yes gene_type:complete